MIPELAYHYGLHSDQVWELTPDELDAYMSHHQEMSRNG